MMKKKLAILSVFLFWLTICAQAEIMDMDGRTLSLERPARRIVVLSAADCEILFALGAGDAVVGRGEYCDYPAEALELPALTSGAETSIESIVALEPDAVILSDMAQTVEQVQALERAGVTVAVSNAQNIEGVYRAIEMDGALCGREQEAQKLISGMKAAFSEISVPVSNEKKTVYFEVSPLEWGLWASGSGTFMDEIADILGLDNIFSDVTGWVEVSEEQVLAADPDYIVTTSSPVKEGQTPEEEIKGRAGWDSLRAVEQNRVFCADSDCFTRPGPRLTEGARALYDFVYGQ